MTKKGAAVLSGYIELTADERQEVRKEIERFENEKLEKRAQLKEQWVRSYGVTLGPVASICPYCGK